LGGRWLDCREDASEGGGGSDDAREERERRETAIDELQRAFHDGHVIRGNEVLRIATAREEACAQGNAQTLIEIGRFRVNVVDAGAGIAIAAGSSEEAR
jgi:hypothetical protein